MTATDVPITIDSRYATMAITNEAGTNAARWLEPKHDEIEEGVVDWSLDAKRPVLLRSPSCVEHLPGPTDRGMSGDGRPGLMGPT